MAGLSKKDTRTLLAHLEKQGATLKKRRDGITVLFPTGGTCGLHWTISDHRAVRNLRADIKRNGMTWPWDGQKEKEIMARTSKDWGLSPAMKARLEAALKKLPDTFRMVELEKAAGVSSPTAYKAIAEFGLLFTEQKYVYRKPGPQVEEEAKPAEPDVEYPEISRAMLKVAQNSLTEAQAIARLKIPGTVIEMPKPIEFIDERDSWTVDLTKIGTKYVSQLGDIFDAAGLDFEIRVWRKK